MTDYSELGNFLDDHMPALKASWRRSFRAGYEANKVGHRRAVHAKGGTRGMWEAGWDKAEKEKAK